MGTVKLPRGSGSVKDEKLLTVARWFDRKAATAACRGCRKRARLAARLIRHIAKNTNG